MTARDYRRDLHRIPEIAFEEHETHDYILSVLNKFNCTIHEVAPTGIIAYFDFGRENTIAFRSDMDALYIEEENDTDYVSEHKNLMHACGHDGHMAALLAFAEYLNANQAENNVVLVFQPAEESILGADLIIKSGILDNYKVCAVFGFHLWPNLEKGVIFTKPGPMMAKASELTIEVFGKSIHVANSEKGIDSLRIATELLTRIYEYESGLDDDIVRLIKFGKMESGTIRNIISAYSRIEGTVRCYDDRIFDMMQNDLRTIAESLEMKHNTEITMSYGDASSPVINDADLLNSLGLDFRILEQPVLQAEDFGNYSAKYPSVFFFLGTGSTPALHTSTFDFDDEILNEIVTLYSTIANKEIQ